MCMQIHLEFLALKNINILAAGCLQININYFLKKIAYKTKVLPVSYSLGYN
jgi:hypothetical protein